MATVGTFLSDERLEFIFHLNQPKIVTNTQIPGEFENYILIENSLDILRDSLEKWKYNFNTRGNILVIFQKNYTEDDLRSAFETLWSFYIYNVVIYNNWTDFVTWYPYKRENKCGNRVNLVTNPKSLNMFENKIPKHLGGCPITVTWNNMSFGIKSPFEDRDPGYVIEAINTIGKIIDANITYLKNNSNYFILSLKTGNYFHLIQDMTTRKIDLGVTIAGESVRFEKELETTKPLFRMDQYFILPPRKKIRNSGKIFGIFSLGTWSITFATLLIMATFWKYLTQISLVTTVFYMVQLSLQCVVNRIPKKTIPRIVFLLYIFFIMNLSWFYTSQMSSVLTSPSYEPKIRTISELVQSEKKLKFYSTYKRHLESYDPKIFEILMSKRLTNSDTLNPFGIIEDFLTHLNFGVILSHEESSHVIKNSQKLEIVSENKIHTVTITLSTRKGFLFLHKLEECILRVQESGLISKWIYDASVSIRKFTVANQEDDAPVPLKLDNIFVSFLILLLGLATSLSIFIIEL
ncbi:uncharacterized protein BDFB_002879, partial [Asbolus verrucosus]